jgi:hypothetical protein
LAGSSDLDDAVRVMLGGLFGWQRVSPSAIRLSQQTGGGAVYLSNEGILMILLVGLIAGWLNWRGSRHARSSLCCPP